MQESHDNSFVCRPKVSTDNPQGIDDLQRCVSVEGMSKSSYHLNRNPQGQRHASAATVPGSLA